VRIYFVSDIHGSDKCWRKFLRAPDFYGADVAIVGGDITGKFLVPIVTEPDGSVSAVYRGVKRRVRNEQELAELRRLIGFGGSYAFEVGREEHDALEHDAAARERLFLELILRRVAEWVALADEQPSERGCRRLVSCGNDDPLEVDAVLETSSTLTVPEGRAVELDDGIELVGVGYANETPWNCPRDVSEEELADRIAAAISELDDPGRAIFDFHVPPYDSGIDEAPKLRADLSAERTPTGDPIMAPAGSVAVREAILAATPLLGLHGHIHEAAGVKELGGTTIVNPGSEYQEGILHGVLIDVEGGRVRRTQLVSG
jgi:uncharacterized protein